MQSTVAKILKIITDLALFSRCFLYRKAKYTFGRQAGNTHKNVKMSNLPSIHISTVISYVNINNKRKSFTAFE